MSADGADHGGDADQPGEGGPLRGLEAIERCFAGAIPAALSTASADGVPNVTWISRAHRVDDERVALSNQFLSKTSRNLAENPRASLLLIDPVSHDEFRLALVYERTERRGRVFDRLRADVDAIAAITGMQDVFRLRAADIFRVVELVQIPPNPMGVVATDVPAPRELTPDLTALAEIAARVGRCSDLDSLVDTVLDGVASSLGFHHVHLMLIDEVGERLYTVGSRGFDAETVGAEVFVGDGLIGIAAARGEPMRVGGLGQMTKYARSMREQFEAHRNHGAGREVPMPAIPRAKSRLVAPAMSAGELVGALVVDSDRMVAFGDGDERVLTIVGTLFASALERVRMLEREEEPVEPSTFRASNPVSAEPLAAPVAVRFFAVDGSTFLDNDYLIKGVAGRILWALLRQHGDDGRVEFTNKELRLDPSLDLPGFKDNLESRLILLKRRLDERQAPVRIERTGRGRMRLCVERPVQLQVTEG
jgi:adenylate cyclase